MYADFSFEDTKAGLDGLYEERNDMRGKRDISAVYPAYTQTPQEGLNG